MSDTPPPRAPERPAGPSSRHAGNPVLETAGTLVERMGIVLVELDVERVVGTMPVAGNTQPYGLLHGGASVVLAETLGSVAAALLAGPGRVAVGVDINATHHRAVRPADPADAGAEPVLVTGVAVPLHAGRTTATHEVVITDAQGRRVCTARITNQLRDAPPGRRG